MANAIQLCVCLMRNSRDLQGNETTMILTMIGTCFLPRRKLPVHNGDTAEVPATMPLALHQRCRETRCATAARGSHVPGALTSLAQDRPKTLVGSTLW
jgi:hypothetical protein